MILLSLASTVSMTYVALALYSFGELIYFRVEFIFGSRWSFHFFGFSEAVFELKENRAKIPVGLGF